MQRSAKSAAIVLSLSLVGVCGTIELAPRMSNAAEPPASQNRLDGRDILMTVREGEAEQETATTTAAPTHYPELALSRSAGNPLWGLSQKTLVATQEAPLFSPSRRPPSIVRPIASEAPHAPVSAPPAPLTVSLVGAISGNAENIAIFVDRMSKDVIRLKTGESYFGWTLKAVKAREATLQRDKEKIILELPSQPAK